MYAERTVRERGVQELLLQPAGAMRRCSTRAS
jgi:hypothetical protein